MAERTLKTRIALLVKSYAEWQSVKDTFVPLKGEMCIVDVPASTGAVAQEPCVLFKIGDGVKTFAQLGYSSAIAADVYAWAKKENLDWNDLNSDFLASLDARIAEKSENVEYQMVGTDGVWKLQKREIGSETWTDVSTVDVAAYVTPLINTEAATRAAEDAKKVDKEITSTDGKAIIFNEADGGGAKFEHTDNTWSFVGVNNGGADGLAAQVYAVDSTDGYKGAKLDVTKGGMYYTTGETSGLPVAQRDVAANELVTRKDLAGGLHYIGSTTLASGETYEQAIARLMVEKSHTPESGDIVIIKSSDSDKEFIYDGSSWVEIGDQGLYATKAELAQEVIDRATADTTLQTNIDARKLEIIPVNEYGFDTNLRVNQQVDGSALVDKVIYVTDTDKKQGIIKTGDYLYNVVSIVNDTSLNIKGFAIETMYIPMSTLADEPAIEKGIFLYNPSLGKTCSFYGKEYTNKEIDAMVAQIQTSLANKLDKDDTLILNCNL